MIIDSDKEAAYAYVLGCYLGDGYIKRRTIRSKYAKAGDPKPISRLMITSDVQYPNVILEQKLALKTLFPDRRIGVEKQASKCVNIYVCSAVSLPDLFPQDGLGRKSQRDVSLKGWQKSLVMRHHRMFLRGLFHTDGSRYEWTSRKANNKRSYKYLRYSFANCSKQIADMFEWALRKEQIVPTRSMSPPKGKYSRTWKVLVSRQHEVKKLDLFLGSKDNKPLLDFIDRHAMSSKSNSSVGLQKPVSTHTQTTL